MPFLVVVLAATLLPAVAAQASHGTTHSLTQFRSGSGPDTINYTHRYEYASGRDASCGPGTGGDGWSCTSHIANLVRYEMDGTISWPNYFNQLGVELLGDGSWRQSNNNYSCGSSTSCGVSYKDYTFTDGPTMSVRGWINYRKSGSCCDSSWNTPSYTVLNFDPIKTASEVTNQAPTVQSVSPSGSIARSAPVEHEQQFSMRATDPEGHRWTGELEITDPDGVVLPLETFSGTRTSSGSTATSNPRTLPHKNGVYTWRARAKDTSGKSTAQGSWVYGDFTYTWNSGPTVPTLQVPAPDGTAAEGAPVTFAIRASDAELDPYDGRIEVRVAGSTTTGWTVSTSQSASDGLSVGTLSGLSARSYEWRARAIDQHDWEGSWPGWQGFEVARTGNSAPATPTLTAPSHGATFADGQA
ncbi:MAG TPA: hypothetical protein VGA69_09340, partial [Nitriliruptorales bacterium]